jgi:MFS family permease
MPVSQRAKYTGMIGAGMGITLVLAPFLGGVFTSKLTWSRLLFNYNIAHAQGAVIRLADVCSRMVFLDQPPFGRPDATHDTISSSTSQAPRATSNNDLAQGCREIRCKRGLVALAIRHLPSARTAMGWHQVCLE